MRRRRGATRRSRAQDRPRARARVIVGNAGILVTRVHLREGRRDKTFTDRRRGDERPHPPDAVRGASRHLAGRARRRRRCRRSSQDIVGPVCETGDYLALDRDAAAAAAGRPHRAHDGRRLRRRACPRATIRGPLVPEVLVNGDDYAVVRPRSGLRRAHRPRPRALMAEVNGRFKISRTRHL